MNRLEGACRVILTATIQMQFARSIDTDYAFEAESTIEHEKWADAGLVPPSPEAPTLVMFTF
jgi:hypothetical protein